MTWMQLTQLYSKLKAPLSHAKPSSGGGLGQCERELYGVLLLMMMLSHQQVEQVAVGSHQHAGYQLIRQTKRSSVRYTVGWLQSVAWCSRITRRLSKTTNRQSVQRIELLFVNMHHLIARMRPNEAMRALVDRMKTQIATRQALVNSLKQ